MNKIQTLKEDAEIQLQIIKIQTTKHNAIICKKVERKSSCKDILNEKEDMKMEEIKQELILNFERL